MVCQPWLCLAAVGSVNATSPLWLVEARAAAWMQRGLQPIPPSALRLLRTANPAPALGTALVMPELLRAPSVALVKFGAAARINLRALGERVMRMTARMALGAEEREVEGEVGADSPEVYSVWRWDDDENGTATTFVGEVFWALKHAFHAFSVSSAGAQLLAHRDAQVQHHQQRRPFFARAWANCMREGQVLGWHWHAEPHDRATTISANLVVAAPPRLTANGRNETTATLFQLSSGSDDGVLRSENVPGDLTLFDGMLWHRTTAPTAEQLKRMQSASSEPLVAPPCRATLAFDITDDPRPLHHFVPLYDPLDPMFERSAGSWSKLASN